MNPVVLRRTLFDNFDTRSISQVANCFRECHALHFLHEPYGVPGGLAAETMVEATLVIYVETRSFFLMEGTEAHKNCALAVEVGQPVEQQRPTKFGDGLARSSLARAQSHRLTPIPHVAKVVFSKVGDEGHEFRPKGWVQARPGRESIRIVPDRKRSLAANRPRGKREQPVNSRAYRFARGQMTLDTNLFGNSQSLNSSPSGGGVNGKITQVIGPVVDVEFRPIICPKS